MREGWLLASDGRQDGSTAMKSVGSGSKGFMDRGRAMPDGRPLLKAQTRPEGGCRALLAIFGIEGGSGLSPSGALLWIPESVRVRCRKTPTTRLERFLQRFLQLALRQPAYLTDL